MSPDRMYQEKMISCSFYYKSGTIMVALIFGSGRKFDREMHADSLAKHFSTCWILWLRNLEVGRHVDF